MKIKIKLSKHELQAFYAVLQETVMWVRQLPEQQERNLRLQNYAQREIMTAFFLRMTNKMDEPGAKNTINIKMTEAWALHRSLNPIVDLLDDYTMTVCLKILSEIHQKTI